MRQWSWFFEESSSPQSLWVSQCLSDRHTPRQPARTQMQPCTSSLPQHVSPRRKGTDWGRHRNLTYRYVQAVLETLDWTGQPPRGESVNRIVPFEAYHMLLLKSSTAEGSAYQERRLSIRDHSASVSGSLLTATRSSEMFRSLI